MNISKENYFKPQVDMKHYITPAYMSPERVITYAYQLREILKYTPKVVLEIGIGNGMLTYMLRKMGIKTISMDIDASLKPDIVASVTNIPLPANEYDVVACFEVLEHIPFDSVLTAFKEICRVSRKHVVVSMPDCRRFVEFEFSIHRIHKPFRLRRKRIGFEIPFLRSPSHNFDGEHYWEINKRNFPLKLILETIKNSGLSVDRTYRIWEHPSIRVFALSKFKS